MITIKTNKKKEVGVRFQKGTPLSEAYFGVAILLNIITQNNGKSIDETLEIIKQLMEGNQNED